MASKHKAAPAAATQGNEVGATISQGAEEGTAVESPATVPNGPATLKALPWALKVDRAAAMPYLRQRGITEATAARYGIGLCSAKSRLFSGYVVMPIFDPHDCSTLVGYVGRLPAETFDEKHPRYKLPKDFPKSRVIFGWRQALEGTDGKPVLVVEGPFDLFRLVQAGYPATVAALGSSLSDEQAALLAGSGRPICLMFDGDAAGQHGMRLAAARLITRTWVRVVKLAEEEQPDRFSAQQLQEKLGFLDP